MTRTLQRADDILATQLDDTLLMLNIRRGRYHGLNEVGARIWQLLERPITEEALVAALLVEFEVSAEQCAGEVKGFLASLRERSLLMDPP